MEIIQNNLEALFVSAFFAILFLQSGLDKVFDYGGNRQYFTRQFQHSPLAKSVGMLLPAITFLEVLTGMVSAAAFVLTLVNGHCVFLLYSPMLAGLTLLCLFFGQRMAKDYAGAAGIVPYFLVALLGIWMLKS